MKIRQPLIVGWFDVFELSTNILKVVSSAQLIQTNKNNIIYYIDMTVVYSMNYNRLDLQWLDKKIQHICIQMLRVMPG